MNRPGPARWLAVVLLWAALAAAMYGLFRAWLAPRQQQAAERAAVMREYEELRATAVHLNPAPEPFNDAWDAAAIREKLAELKERLLHPSDPPVKHRVKLALDSFSGYAVLRSKEFDRELRVRGIALELVDDGADYPARIESLATGNTPLAAFTIDALIKTCAERKSIPAKVVWLIDETTGADAMIAYRDAVPDLVALNNAATRFVLTRDSPSETLARVVMAGFNLPRISREPWIGADGAEDVYRRFLQADRQAPQAFVLWEPYVSRALAETPGAHRLLDSSRFTGYIVDVLVVQEDFLLANRELLTEIAAAYFRVAHSFWRQPDGAAKLVRSDAAGADPLTEEQARQLVRGIWWKNTVENYAHFGLPVSGDSHSLLPLATMIRNITTVLLETGSIAADPAGGDAGRLYYDGILRGLQQSQFHPNLSGPGETLRAHSAPTPLTEGEWRQLQPVGELKVDRIVFRPGGHQLLQASEHALRRLAETLRAWPQAYLLVQGNARVNANDPPEVKAAAAELAARRAQQALEFLVAAGVETDRLRAVASDRPGAGGEAQSVTFTLGQRPY